MRSACPRYATHGWVLAAHAHTRLPPNPPCRSLNPALPHLKDDEGNDVQFRRTLLNKCQVRSRVAAEVTGPALCLRCAGAV